MEKVIKKRLIKLGVMAAAALSLVLAFGFILDSQTESVQADFDNLNQQISMQKARMMEVTSKHKTIIDAATFYDEYKKLPSSRPENYEREAVKNSLFELWQQYGLNKLEFESVGFKEAKNPISTPESIALKNKLDIKFRASYDVPIYDFLAALEDSLPGVVSISSVNITTDAKPDDTIISEIAAGKQHDLIKGEIKLYWFAVVDPLSVGVPKAIDAVGAVPDIILKADEQIIPQMSPKPVVPQPELPKLSLPEQQPVPIAPPENTPENKPENKSVEQKLPNGAMKLDSIKPQMDLQKTQEGSAP